VNDPPKLPPSTGVGSVMLANCQLPDAPPPPPTALNAQILPSSVLSAFCSPAGSRMSGADVAPRSPTGRPPLNEPLNWESFWISGCVTAIVPLRVWCTAPVAPLNTTAAPTASKPTPGDASG
jgi:hypothetical protein